MRRAFVFDQEKCMGCHACTVTCKDWNQVNPGPARWRTQFTHEYNDNFFPLSMGCNHCKEPACKAACPYNAIIKRAEDGLVYVDRTLCQGAKSCVTACPFATPQIAGPQQEPQRFQGWLIDHPMQKCDFCMSRVDQGTLPACVMSCPAFALDMGDYDELIARYAAETPPVTLVPLSRAEFPYAFVPNNSIETGPSFLVKKRGSLTIIKNKG